MHTNTGRFPRLLYGVVPDMPLKTLALLLCGTLGLMGILTPYATGPSPIYYGSGYIPTAHYWRLGAIFGVIFLAVLLVKPAGLFGRATR